MRIVRRMVGLLALESRLLRRVVVEHRGIRQELRPGISNGPGKAARISLVEFVLERLVVRVAVRGSIDAHAVVLRERTQRLCNRTLRAPEIHESREGLAITGRLRGRRIDARGEKGERQVLVLAEATGSGSATHRGADPRLPHKRSSWTGRLRTDARSGSSTGSYTATDIDPARLQ